MPLGVSHAHFVLFHLEDTIRSIAQLEDIAGQTFKGEVLVQCSDKVIFRFQHHVVIKLVRYHAAIGYGGQRGAFPGPDAFVYRIIVNITALPAAPGCKPLRQHIQQFIELVTRQVTVWIGQCHPLEHLIFLPFPAGRFGNELLCQHVQVAPGYPEPVQFIAPDRVKQRYAFHQFVPGQGKQAALGNIPQAMAGASDPLQENGNGPGRAQLTNEVNIPYIDAQFQGCGCNQCLEFTPFQALFGIQAMLLCQAAVVGGNVLFADAFSQTAGCPLSQAAGIDKDQRGFVLLNQVGQLPVQFLPHFPGHHGLQG